MRTTGGFILSSPYSKPALTPDGHLLLLRERGLVVKSDAEALRLLKRIGYYRLSAYMRPLQLRDGSHKFIGGTTLDQIADLYDFDRKLRIHLLDALERIEIAFKTGVNNAIAVRHGPHWFSNQALFKPSLNHPSFIGKIKREIGFDEPHKRSVAVQHYYDTYTSPDLPPSWVLLEAISFGSLAFFIRHLVADEMKAVGKAMNFPDTLIESWCLAMSYVRNLCAHHQRVWNRIMTIKPIISSALRSEMDPNDMAYAQFVAISHMMKLIAPASKWNDRLKVIFAEHPNANLDAMGFPENWATRPFWR